jgi:hypothetical protein
LFASRRPDRTLGLLPFWIYVLPMSKDKKPAGKPAAKPAASGKPAAKAAAPVKRPVFQAPPKPGGNFPGSVSGKGGPKPGGPTKGRIFRHQGR